MNLGDKCMSYAALVEELLPDGTRECVDRIWKYSDAGMTLFALYLRKTELLKSLRKMRYWL
jgi:hypothetical protein